MGIIFVPTTFQTPFLDSGAFLVALGSVVQAPVIATRFSCKLQLRASLSHSTLCRVISDVGIP